MGKWLGIAIALVIFVGTSKEVRAQSCQLGDAGAGTFVYNCDVVYGANDANSPCPGFECVASTNYTVQGYGSEGNAISGGTVYTDPYGAPINVEGGYNPSSMTAFSTAVAADVVEPVKGTPTGIENTDQGTGTVAERVTGSIYGTDGDGDPMYSGFYKAPNGNYYPIQTSNNDGRLAGRNEKPPAAVYNCPQTYYADFSQNYSYGCMGGWGWVGVVTGNMVQTWPPEWNGCVCDPEDIGCSGTPYKLASQCLPLCTNGTVWTQAYANWGYMAWWDCSNRGGYLIEPLSYDWKTGDLKGGSCMVPSGYTCEQCGTDPQAPTLVSPANGATLEAASTTLTWNKIQGSTNWGLAAGSCGAVSDSKYNIYIGYSPSSLYFLTSKPHLSIATYGATESFTFTNNSTQRIYWKIEAESASGRKTSSETWNFIKASREAWWQAVGAGIYAGSTAGGTVVQSKAPAGEYLIEPGVGGAIGALMRSSGVANVGSGTVSTAGYSTKASYKGKRTDYQYFAAGMGVTPNTVNAWGADTMNKPANNPAKDFYFINPSSNTATISTPWSVLAGESYVVFVDGNLTIASNVTVADGGFLAFIVSGNITVDPSVTSMQGLYLADGNFITSSNGGTDVALAVQGSVVAWSGVDLNRDMKAGNTNPGEQFTYRPDLIENMPDKMKVFGLEWKEVAPGTFN